ncbi:MAG: outer membrane lipoprotein-sorting protein [Myxococcota bacterium]
MRLFLSMLLLAAPAWAAEPTAAEILARYDQVMGPLSFDAKMSMTARREDGSERTYVMKVLKSGQDKLRIWFLAPSAVKGQEMLRNGDNLWVYLPNLKRATRIANRDSFQGGDFNNADVLRVNYQADYEAKLVAPHPNPLPEGEGAEAEMYQLELQAKHGATAYDVIKLWVRKKDLMPMRGEYYGTSGQMIRSAEFSDFQELDKGYVRPARVVMKNELVKARRSEMRVESMRLSVDAPPQRFTQTDLGR